MGYSEVIKKDGSKIILSSVTPFRSVRTATQEKSMMGEDTVKLSIVSSDVLNFDKGDKIIVGGEEYRIRTSVTREKVSEEHYIYDVTFYGVMYELMKSIYRDTQADGKSSQSSFDLTYSIKDFVKVIIYNTNRDYPGLWQFDEDSCPETEPRTIQFSNQNCLQVLQTICSDQQFKLEFRITQKDGVRTIHIGKFGDKVAVPGGGKYFEYGKGAGLYSIKEDKVDDKAIITRLWVEGGSDNIRTNYRDYSERLQLPYPSRLNRNEHTLDDGTIVRAGSETIGIDDDSKRYIEDAELAAKIGSDEDVEHFSDIYPKRTGVVTSVFGDDICSFADNTMDFDLNEKGADGTKYMINGVSPKITFVSGRLAGQQFDLSKYDHKTKKFKIVAFTDKRKLTIPTKDNEAYRISEGDKYKITDIMLPKAYEDNAEEELWYAGIESFRKRKQARAKYQLVFDRSYLINSLPSDSDICIFNVGDYVPVRDLRFGIEKDIRIQSVTRNLLLKHDYNITLSDIAAVSIQMRTILDVANHNQIIELNNLKDINRARRGWRTTEELRNMVYDTDGYFDVDNIRPNSIDANMLTIGSKSQQFVLVGVVLEANANGLANKFVASGGVLAHLAIEDNVREWYIPNATFTLNSQEGYYLFVKCAKNGDRGTWYVTQNRLKVENVEDPNNLYFQVGIIGSLETNVGFRDFTTTYGFTRINGNTITTGKIVTSDGQCYLDLDGNRFRVGDSNSSLTWQDGRLLLKGTLVQSLGGETSEIGVYRGPWSSSATYYKGDEVSCTGSFETCTYRYINDSPSSNKRPSGYVSYWTVVARGRKGDKGDKGDAGLQGLQGPKGDRGIPGTPGANGKSSYTHIAYADTPNGGGFSQNPSGKKYIGTYTDFVQADSSDPGRYKWSLIKGADGSGVYLAYKNSDTKPAKPTQTEQEKKTQTTPSGWYSEPEDAPSATHGISNIRYSGSWTKQMSGINKDFYKSNSIAHNGFTKMRIMFDAEAGAELDIALIASSEANYDVLAISEVNKAINSASDYENSSVIKAKISGEKGTRAKYQFQSELKNAFIDFAYKKDGSGSKYDDAGYFSVSEPQSSVWWQSSARQEFAADGTWTMSDWTEPVRITGKDGNQGEKGEKGDSPVSVFRGEYNSFITYYGNPTRRDVVRYSGTYYIANIDAGAFSSVTPSNTSSKWENFGAQFSSVATGLLLAENASIGDWFLSGGKIVSTLSNTDKNGKISLDAKNSEIEVLSNKVIDSDGILVGGEIGEEYKDLYGNSVRCITQISSSKACIRSKLSRSDTSGVPAPEAVFSALGARFNTTNFAKKLWYPVISRDRPFLPNAMDDAAMYTAGVLADCVTNFGRGGVAQKEHNFSTAVFGRVHNKGGGPGYGGYFVDLKAAGLCLGTQYVDGFEQGSNRDYIAKRAVFVLSRDLRDAHYLGLPPDVHELGKTIICRNMSRGTMYVQAWSGEKIVEDGTWLTSFGVSTGQMAIFVYMPRGLYGSQQKEWIATRLN